MIACGKHTKKLMGKSPLFMDKLSINGHVQETILNYQMINDENLFPKRTIYEYSFPSYHIHAGKYGLQHHPWSADVDHGQVTCWQKS